jgi:hypothetical protein
MKHVTALTSESGNRTPPSAKTVTTVKHSFLDNIQMTWYICVDKRLLAKMVNLIF